MEQGKLYTNHTCVCVWRLHHNSCNSSATHGKSYQKSMLSHKLDEPGTPSSVNSGNMSSATPLIARKPLVSLELSADKTSDQKSSTKESALLLFKDT